jgi:3-deoxy-7-phosphoheptulonate synthase
VVIGPCSIHDYDAVMEYARRRGADRLQDDLLVVMRVYFESPAPRWLKYHQRPAPQRQPINEGVRLPASCCGGQ